jgi:hypothetical protein
MRAFPSRRFPNSGGDDDDDDAFRHPPSWIWTNDLFRANRVGSLGHAFHAHHDDGGGYDDVCWNGDDAQGQNLFQSWCQTPP